MLVSVGGTIYTILRYNDIQVMVKAQRFGLRLWVTCPAHRIPSETEIMFIIALSRPLSPPLIHNFHLLVWDCFVWMRKLWRLPCYHYPGGTVLCNGQWMWWRRYRIHCSRIVNCKSPNDSVLNICKFWTKILQLLVHKANGQPNSPIFEVLISNIDDGNEVPCIPRATTKIR